VERYEPAMSFDGDVARSYDEGLRGDENAAVAFLKDAAGGGPALELAIGTGRIAVPLAAEGIRTWPAEWPLGWMGAAALRRGQQAACLVVESLNTRARQFIVAFTRP
jgi:hypothetical protein